MTPRDESPELEALRAQEKPVGAARLRILATTDLHMQLLGHDYVSDRPLGHRGLASLATLIRQARREAAKEGTACLLFDNGDLLQGNALGGLMASQKPGKNHPLVAIMNTLAYDAIGLGNHDLDEGLDYLQGVARHLDMPVVSSNLRFRGETPVRRSALITARTGQHMLRLGVLSALPSRTAIWNEPMLAGLAEVEEPGLALQREAKRLRAAGADLVILLAHLDIEDTDMPDQMAGFDAIVAGHTHGRMPQSGVQTDADSMGQPRIMPGHEGADLAVLDLTLDYRDRWIVSGHNAALRENTGDVPPAPPVLTLCKAAHRQIRQHLGTPVGETDAPLHNFFGPAQPSRTAALLAMAKAMAVRKQLQGQDRDLPILASAPAQAAGLAGQFLHIPKGPILRRHITGLAPHRDTVAALRISGAGLRIWLERSAGIFARLEDANPDQALVRPEVPPFCSDTIFGLTYRIDPTRPAGQRIGALCHAGKPVEDGQTFILATSSFRAGGGGGLLPDNVETAPLKQALGLQEALTEALSNPAMQPWANPVPWHFAPSAPASATLRVVPEALDWLAELAELSPEQIGAGKDGRPLIRLTLG